MIWLKTGSRRQRWRIREGLTGFAQLFQLETACAEALKQIEDRKYEEGLKRRGMKKIIKYRMAFCEKECMVVMA